MLKTITLFIALMTATFARASETEQEQIWNLEKAYWKYVKTDDLEKYQALWHENFLGWPFVSPVPVRKDHITDWIAANTSKGLMLQSYSIEQLAIQVTGDIATDYYRINANWAGGGDKVRSDKLRIAHTWFHTRDGWQIIGGMSAPVNAEGK